MNPRVSVIIPCYNTAGLVAETLDSVLAQTYREFEVIVINDGSPDTPALELVLQPYRQQIRYVVKENGGLASARNAGIAVAQGELVAFLDSDDAWTPEYLAVQVSQLDQNPSADIVYPNVVFFGEGETGHRLYRQMSAPMPEVTFTTLVNEECCVVVSVVARKAALTRVGLFDENLRRCEDFDLWLRCAKSGIRIIYHQQPLVRYRIRNGSLSANPAAMFADAARVLRKNQAAFELTVDEEAALECRLRLSDGNCLFHQGKAAFFAGDYTTAIAKLREANRFLNSGGISRVLLLLRTAPSLARRAYIWMHRERAGG